VQLLELPQSSVAIQVRVIVLSWGHAPGAATSLKVRDAVASQLSVAVATPVLAGKVLAVHSIVTLAGQVMTGGVLSSMDIDCVQVLVLPQSSKATQVRVIVPSCGHAPATVASLKVKEIDKSQLSVAVGVPVLAGKVLAEHWIVILTGHVICGPELSVTMIIWRQVLLFPQPSDATQVRLIVNKVGHTPPTVTSLKVMIGVKVQLSVAVAVPVFTGNELFSHWIVTLAGQVITGGTLSSTNIN
jgi:hypothetical protein